MPFAYDELKNILKQVKKIVFKVLQFLRVFTSTLFVNM